MRKKVDSIRRSPVKTNSAIVYARRSAEFLLKEIGEKGENQHLMPSFVFSICAGVEAAINDIYIDFFHRKMGREYKECVKPLIYLRIREKLILVVPLVSGFRYKIDESNEDFKAIITLFDLRNALIHAKQHWHPAIVEQRGSSYFLHYENKAALDFYSSDTPKISIQDLRQYLKLFGRLIVDFHNLGGSIGTAGKFERKGENGSRRLSRTLKSKLNVSQTGTS